MKKLEERLSEAAQRSQACLQTLLDDAAVPQRLADAMRHAVLGGGKRLRPFLVIETARLFGHEDAGVDLVAAAVECVHCYSLVHDDLPSMDDDDMRRGRPTVHRAFDEATAILAGDALQTLAFETLADARTGAAAECRAAMVLVLAGASGGGGMVGGQMLDLSAEGRFAADNTALKLDEQDILRMQAMKTGALIRASVELGALVADADRAHRGALLRYGSALGQAFQIADDLLDAEADGSVIGKATGKDAARGKATLVGIWGAERARARLAEIVAEAEQALDVFGKRGDVLREAAHFVANRDR